MLSDITTEQVFLACGATDLRKSIDGLAAIVQLGFERDPFSGVWFIFCNRDRDKLKMLRWDHNGFWLYYRRLEKGRFQWPTKPKDSAYVAQTITRRQLTWLLDGLKLEQRRAHPAVNSQSVA
jgi:transposase